MWRNRSTVRLALCASVVCAPVAAVQAQGQIGAVIGATFASFRGIDGLDSRTGLMGGLSLVLPLVGGVALQPELLLVSKGAEGSEPDLPGIKLNYVEVPVLLRLSLGQGGLMNPHLYAGPYLGYNINCTVEGTSADCDDVPGISTKTVDVGGALGGGIDVSLGGLVLTGGLRYSFGISKVADFDAGAVNESAKNGVFAVYTGLAIRFGR
jgi:hypothetical protein